MSSSPKKPPGPKQPYAPRRRRRCRFQLRHRVRSGSCPPCCGMQSWSGLAAPPKILPLKISPLTLASFLGHSSCWSCSCAPTSLFPRATSSSFSTAWPHRPRTPVVRAPEGLAGANQWIGGVECARPRCSLPGQKLPSLGQHRLFRVPNAPIHRRPDAGATTNQGRLSSLFSAFPRQAKCRTAL